MEDLVEEEHLKLRNTWVDWETADGETFHGLGVFPKFKNNPPGRSGARCRIRVATPSTS